MRIDVSTGEDGNQPRMPRDAAAPRRIGAAASERMARIAVDRRRHRRLAPSAAWLMAEGHAVTVFERAPEGRPASDRQCRGDRPPRNLAARPARRHRPVPALAARSARPAGGARPRPAGADALSAPLHRRGEAASGSRRRHAALAWLMSTALADHEELARRSGLSGHMRRTGALHVIDGEAGYRAARRRSGPNAAAMASRSRRSRRAAARKLVPALTGKRHARLLRARLLDGDQSARHPRGAAAPDRRLPARWIKQDVDRDPPRRPRGLGDHRRGRRPALRPGGDRRRGLVARPGPHLGLRVLSRGRARLQHHLPSASGRPADAGVLLRARLRRARRSPSGSGSAARWRWHRRTHRPTTPAPRRCGRSCAATSPTCPRPAASNGWAAGRRRRIRCR